MQDGVQALGGLGLQQAGEAALFRGGLHNLDDVIAGLGQAPGRDQGPIDDDQPRQRLGDQGLRPGRAHARVQLHYGDPVADQGDEQQRRLAVVDGRDDHPVADAQAFLARQGRDATHALGQFAERNLTRLRRQPGL